MGFFDKLKKITSNLFSGFTEADEAFFEELEETLIMADLGVDAATDAVEKLRTKVRKEHLQSQEAVREALREILMAEMEVGDTAMKLDTKPSVCIFIGVNGVGKTTSIGKIARQPEKAGQAGAAVRRRYLPGCRRRPAGDLGGAGRMRDRPAVRGRGPRRRAVRRPAGCQGPERGCGAVRHRRTAPQQGKPDGGAGQAVQDHRPGVPRLPTGRRCWCWTPPPARTA